MTYDEYLDRLDSEELLDLYDVLRDHLESGFVDIKDVSDKYDQCREKLLLRLKV